MKLILAFLALLVIPFSAQAGEEDLYAPVPPADSAFVRTVNLTGDDKAAIQLGGASFPASAQALVSDYIVIKQGEHSLTVGEKSQAVTIEAKQYYTVAVAKDGTANVLKDGLIEDPSKAMLYFYNLSDAASASLFAPSHKASIFENIAAGTSTSRTINPVTIDVDVKAGDAVVGTQKAELKRQAGTSVFLVGEKDAYTAFTVQNKVAQ